MDERRKNRRDRTYLHGQIAFNHRQSTLDCTVRNLSHDGVLLELSATVTVPGRFDLAIRHKGDSREARIVWRDEDFIGASFEQPTASATVIPLEAARRIRALEAERETLMRRIRQISEPA